MQFAWRFLGWKSRMVFNAIAGRREYLAIGIAAGLLTLSGGGILASRLGAALAELYHQEPEGLLRALSLFSFSLYLAIFFMALANVITRFFGSGRLDERENLMGPLSGHALYAAELLDALRLPLLFIVGMGLIPAAVACIEAELPLWIWLWLSLNASLLYIQPTLVVLALSILGIRLLPRALIGKKGLLFLVMFIAAIVGMAGLDAIRMLLAGRAEGWHHLLPSYPVALILPAFQGGETGLLLGAFAVNLAITLFLLALSNYLYRTAFLGALEHFRLAGVADEVGSQQASWLFRLVRRLFNPTVAALVVKDLRSFRRETAQRIAFTLIAALMSALVFADLLSGFGLSAMFMPIFGTYAMFLVCCQGLSTFSAEGGRLDNLARLPLSARELLTGKVLAHTVLYLAVAYGSALLMAIAPSVMPWFLQIPVVLTLALLSSPLVIALAIITVSLGAIFPKPGEGGAQKEISIFAMGLFLHLSVLICLSLGAAFSAGALGAEYLLLIPVVALFWGGILYLLWHLAQSSVRRMMGT